MTPTFLCVCVKCKAGGKAPHADTTVSLRYEPVVRTENAGKKRRGGGINRLDEKLHAAVTVIDCWM